MKKLIYFLVLTFFTFSSCTTAIPDANFEQALIDLGIDSDGVINQRVLTDDISVVTSLEIPSKGIRDLTGIEDFSSLIYLKCDSNRLESLDLSQNTALETLWCNWNQLTNLEVSGATALKTIWCSQNRLTSLDVSQNVALEYLNCHYNNLISLDVSQNRTLKELICWHNELTTITMDRNIALTHLACGINQLTSLDLSGATALETLSCNKNHQLTELDVSQNAALKSMNLIDNKLTYLNAKNGNNSRFTFMNATSNPLLLCIDVDNVSDANAGIGGYNIWRKDSRSHYTDNCLINTYVPDDSFEHTLIRYSHDAVLDDFVLTANINTIRNYFFDEGTELNQDVQDLTGIEDFVELRTLSTYSQPTQIVDLSSNVKLTGLRWGSRLDSINLTNNVDLKNLTLVGPLENIDLTNNLNLEDLTLGNDFTPGAQGIDITDLDLSSHTSLNSINLYAPLLRTLNVQNGNNENLDFFHFLNYCPTLTCIQVDDAAYSTANWSMYVLPGTIFSEDCSPIWSAAPIAMKSAKTLPSFESKYNANVKREIKALKASFKKKVNNLEQYETYRTEMQKLILKGNEELRIKSQ